MGISSNIQNTNHKQIYMNYVCTATIIAPSLDKLSVNFIQIYS